MSVLPYDDSLSETSSIADEERVRKLFQACDYNGDGFIDSSDLETVCRELELGQCVQELLSQLGADHSGRVSYQDFLSRRRALRCEIAALKEADALHSGGGSSQDLQATASNSGNSFTKQELWEWDSGARDLSPESSVQPAPAPPDTIAELASTLHLAAVSSLKNEVLELSARLHAAHRDRDSAREALVGAQNECIRLRGALTAQARASEERMTELHGVIAELQRAGAARGRATIPELGEEDSELDTSCLENSVTGGVGSSRTTSPDETEEKSVTQNQQVEACVPVRPPSSPSPPTPPPPQTHFLRANEPTTDTTGDDDTRSINATRTAERCRRRLSPRSRPRGLVVPAGDSANDAGEETDDPPSPHRPRIPHSACIRGSPVSSQTKMASRVRLRRTHEDSRLTGKDICQEGVYSSAVAEHLSLPSNIGDGDERTRARIDRLEADNVLLAATLRDSKEHTDRLSLACAQCTAEAGALRVALAAADRAVEAYDVLLALAETQTPSMQDSGSTTQKMRVATERVARQLLARLDADAAGLCQLGEVQGPWGDPRAVLLYPCSGNSNGEAWSAEEEERLRSHVSRLKRERTIAASGAQPAPWPLQDDSGCGESGSGERSRLDAVDVRKLDMETAVLLQEVMGLREERAELRARLRALRPQAQPTGVTVASLGEEGESERRLLESLARENTLKTRLQRLMASVHQAGKGNEEDRGKVCCRCSPQNRSAPTNPSDKDDKSNKGPSVSSKDPAPTASAKDDPPKDKEQVSPCKQSDAGLPEKEQE